MKPSDIKAGKTYLSGTGYKWTVALICQRPRVVIYYRSFGCYDWKSLKDFARNVTCEVER